LRIHLLTVSKPRDAALLALCDRYIQRASPVFRIEWSAVPDGDPRGSKVPARAVEAEGQRLLKRLDAGCLAVALDERGKTRTSRELARWLGRLRDEGQSLQLVVGGAHGLAPAVLKRCPQRMALSAMTLPHDLALVVLLEQLFRARAILMGEPYHH